MTTSDLVASLQNGNAPLILDVRSRLEYVHGHIPGAVHMPFWATPTRAHELAAHRDQPIVVYCGHGPRAHLAGAALRARGFRQVMMLEGHWRGWKRGKGPKERG